MDIGEAQVAAQVWEVRVGQTPLYLLDTNIEDNPAADRLITATLYGGDRDMRIRQEILLGVGGIRALQALGFDPVVTHMNEGHSAFLALERMRCLMREKGVSFEEAAQAVWPTSIFTTHTPVPAGNERFPPDLMARYFRRFAGELGISWKDFLALGRENPDNDQESFCMTVLALRLSACANGVSQLHGRTSRRMWNGLWPGLPVEEVPIRAITNGVHPRTWISHDMIELLDRYLGPRFQEEPTNPDVWDRIEKISDEELFRTHERRRERLVAFARNRLRLQLKRRGTTEAELATAEDALSPYALTICFARRFASYKRANLLLRDRERLLRLLTDPQRPVQLIFAGKAHPHDLEGKEIIREIIHFAQDPQVRTQVVFLEDYDMTMARYLLSGCDVWLNNPRRPLEASGTSGMKAALNGALNLSCLDGWWDEGYDPECGWAIGHGEEYGDPKLQDEVEGKALYDLLEREIVPLFYARGRDGLPRGWIRRMKASMSWVGRRFTSHRMLQSYAEQFYLPALQRAKELCGEDFRRCRELAAYRRKLESVLAAGAGGVGQRAAGGHLHRRRAPGGHRARGAGGPDPGGGAGGAVLRADLLHGGDRAGAHGGDDARGRGQGELRVPRRVGVRPHRAPGLHGARAAQAPGPDPPLPAGPGALGLRTAGGGRLAARSSRGARAGEKTRRVPAAGLPIPGESGIVAACNPRATT